MKTEILLSFKVFLDKIINLDIGIDVDSIKERLLMTVKAQKPDYQQL